MNRDVLGMMYPLGAILAFAEKVKANRKIDILEKTYGVWQREESVEETIDQTREKFRSSVMRHQA